MATNYTAPFGRIKWCGDIIPMSEVREIEVHNYNGEPCVRFCYVNVKDYTRLYFNDEEERQEFLDRLNEFLNQLSDDLRNKSYTPDLGWTDFTPPPPARMDLSDINQVIDEIQEVLDKEEPEEVVLQEPDTRPAWQKILKPNR